MWVRQDMTGHDTAMRAVEESVLLRRDVALSSETSLINERRRGSLLLQTLRFSFEKSIKLMAIRGDSGEGIRLVLLQDTFHETNH